jgi:hypothetical protein
VATLYLALFAIMLAAALLLVPGNLLGLVLGHPAGVADQVSLAWLARRFREFVDLNPESETAVDRLAGWLAAVSDDE